MEDNQIQKEIQSQNQLSNDEIISWGQLLSEAKDTLTKANVPDADIDAWLLMEHCFSITKSFFFLNRRQIVESKEKIKQYREFIKQRSAYSTSVSDKDAGVYGVRVLCNPCCFDTEAGYRDACRDSAFICKG